MKEEEVARVTVSTPPFSSPDPATDGMRMKLIEEGGEGSGTGMTQPEAPSVHEQTGDGGSEGPTKAELYERAGELEIEGRSKMDKEELQAAIEEAEAESNQ